MGSTLCRGAKFRPHRHRAKVIPIMSDKRERGRHADEPLRTYALSPADPAATQKLVEAHGEKLGTIREQAAGAETPFDSLRKLSAHLSATFKARLVFVSVRNLQTADLPAFVFDTVLSDFSAERAKLFAMRPPLDVAVADLGRPLIWQPEAGLGRNATPLGTSGGQALVAVPYKSGPILALCAAQVPEDVTPPDTLQTIA